MLAAKQHYIAFVFLWHYFCASESFFSIYLTVFNNNYPIKELLFVELRAKGSELRIDNSMPCALRVKNAYRFEYW